MKTQRIFTMIAVLASWTSGLAQSDSSVPAVINPGDMLDIKVFYTPELNTQARVSNDGVVIMPLLGAVPVAGLDTQQAGKEIGQRLVKGNFYLAEPNVSVFISDSAMQRVSVFGEVKNPGSLPLFGRLRLLDIVSAAGGLLPSASGLVTVTHRGQSDKAQSFRIGGALASMENPEIASGDTILVEKAGIVYVVGGVNRPGGFMLENGKHLTLLQAIALAEGTAPRALLKDARLIRQVDDKRQEIPIDIKAVLKSHAEDLTLQSDDILFIPSSAFRGVMERGVEGAIQIATGVSIYRF